MLNRKNFFISLLFLLFLVSCNTTKYVPDGDFLVDKVIVSYDTKIIPKEEVKSYIRQMPNTKTLGLFKMQLGLYNFSGRDSTKSINRFFRRIGDAPVILDNQLTEMTENQIKMLFFNRGFMNAYVKSTIDSTKEKKATIKYTIQSNTPYKLRSYYPNIEHSELLEIASDTARSVVKPEKQLFDTEILDKERDRIVNRFRDLGYFNFTKDHLHFYVDSALNNHEVDLVLEVLEDKNNSDTLLFQKYTINKVNFFSSADKTIENLSTIFKLDTIVLNDYQFIYEGEQNIRPSVLIQSTHLVPNRPFSDRAVERSFSSLNSLSAVKYVDISFKEIENCKLDVNIVVTPNKLQTFSTDVEGTYSAGYWGIGGNLNYGHRNVFKGSETFSLRGRALYEYQGFNQNAYEFGGDAGLKFPTFMLPFATKEFKRNVRATTEFTGSFSYRERPKEYTGIITGAGFNYNWSEKLQINHHVDVLNVSYVHYPYISDEYREYLSTSPYFAYNFQNHLIMRAGYSGSFSGYRAYQPLRNYSSYSYAVEVAGNTLYALNNLLQSPTDTLGSYRIFGIRYAQYLKADFNVTHHQLFDKNNRIVYHLGVGMAVPYGNNPLVPFEKRYFSGGANSVRGWTSYQLGPGKFKSKGGYIDYNTQMGDIRLDMNMEYRTKLFWKLEGALFLDAGNVWTIRDYDSQPGGVFRFSTFMDQLGIAYGAGIRADFSFVVFRVDLGFKLHDPALPRLEKWRTKITANDYAFNLAIGYPF